MSIGKLFLLGDSYSTFQDAIPKGYACWYTVPVSNDTDVDRVEQTWWHQFVEKTGATLLLNDSFSGATVCNTGYDGGYCPDSSFVGRLDRILEQGKLHDTPDTVLIEGGTNDSWAGSPVGELQYGNWSEEDKRFALPAVCYLLDTVKKAFPSAQIAFVLNHDLKPAITDGYKEACRHYNVQVIALHDIEKQDGHPNRAGMKRICDQVHLSFQQKTGGRAPEL